MIPGVVCTGNIVMDVLVRPADEITWGGTRWVDAITESLGGNGANTSATLGKLGVPVTLLGAVGDDAFGEAALARLRECGVNTGSIQTLGAGTAASVALVRSDGARAFLHQPGVSRLLFSHPPDLAAAAAGATRLHVANPFAVTHLRSYAPQLLAAARKLGLATSLDTAWDALGEWMAVLGPSLPLVDLLFTNEDEARMLTGTGEPEEAARRLRQQGASVVVIKLGGQGCAIYSADEHCRIPAFAVRAVDTTGAGDCFAGGLLAALQRGYNLRDAAQVANALGALSVQCLGATSGLLGWQETLDWMDAGKGYLPIA